jgi:hypothetical protein
MDIAKLIGTVYLAGCFTALGLGAFFNKGGGLQDKAVGLGALAVAGGFAEMSSRLAQ